MLALPGLSRRRALRVLADEVEWFEVVDQRWAKSGRQRKARAKVKRKEQEFGFAVIETVSYQIRAKGATVEKAA